MITFNNEDNVIEIQGTEVLSEPAGNFSTFTSTTYDGGGICS